MRLSRNITAGVVVLAAAMAFLSIRPGYSPVNKVTGESIDRPPVSQPAKKPAAPLSETVATTKKAGPLREKVPNTTKEGSVRDWVDPVIQFWVSVGASILASYIFGYFVGRKRTLNSYYPRRIKRGTRKNTVLVVGQGRSGKTCLIEALTKTLDPKLPELTNNFEIKSCKKEEGDQCPVYFHFTDYRGQNFSQLISSFIQEQLVPNSLLRFGDINSLILVVDIFGANDEDEGELVRRFAEIDEERVRLHLREWNTTALDAVFGLLTKKQLKYVCLFVNKIDKWYGGIDAEKIVKELFSPLVGELRERARGHARFDVIIGSALQGTAVSGMNGSLMQKLFRYSVPLLKEDQRNER